MPYKNAIIHAFRAVLGLSVLFFASFAFGGMLLGYLNSLQILAAWAGQGYKVDKIAVFLSPSSFRVFLLMAFILSLLAGWLLLQLPRFSPLLSRGLFSLRSSIRSLLRGIAGSGLFYVLMLPLLASVWFALKVPVNYDEAYTYLHFTEKSPIASLCYYPVPNNHVLHSLITNATRHLPFSDPLTRLRASSIVINMLIWILAFRFVQRWWDTRTAQAAVAIGSVLFMAVYYSFMSRGYALVCLAFIGALYAVSAYIHQGSRRYLHWFAVFSIIGFFTMPSFLYPWLSLNVWWRWQSRTPWRPQFVTNLFIVIGVGLLYMPIMLVSGLASLTSNPFVRPIDRMQVFAGLGPFFRQVLAELTGLPPVLVLLWLVAGLFFAFRRMPTVWWSFFVTMLIAAPLLLLLHSVIPFPRTFVYYGWVITLLLVLPWSALLARIPRGIFIPVLLIIQACFLYNFHHRIAAYESYNTSFHDINRQIVGPHTYYVNSRIFDTSLHFALRQTGFGKSIRQSIYPPVPVSADSIRGYDYIIIDKEFDRTVRRKPMISDAYVNLYHKE